jgi:hypothetical protein
MTDQSKTTEEIALDLLCAMRPDVPRESFIEFVRGDPSWPYLHVSRDEIERIAHWARRAQERGGYD